MFHVIIRSVKVVLASDFPNEHQVRTGTVSTQPMYYRTDKCVCGLEFPPFGQKSHKSTVRIPSTKCFGPRRFGARRRSNSLPELKWIVAIVTWDHTVSLSIWWVHGGLLLDHSGIESGNESGIRLFRLFSLLFIESKLTTIFLYGVDGDSFVCAPSETDLDVGCVRTPTAKCHVSRHNSFWFREEI